MQKFTKKSILFLVMINVCNPVNAGLLDEPEKYWKEISACAALAVSGVSLAVGYLLRGKNYEAERLEQERHLRNEKRENEAIENKEKAQKTYYEIKNKRKEEFNHIKRNNGEIAKETIEKISLYTSHNQYVEEIHDDLEKLYPLHDELKTKSQQKKIEKMIAWLKLIEERNYLYFKEMILQEREKEREEKKKQQIFALQLANKQEKLKAKKIKTKSIEEIAQQAKNAINSTTNNAEALMTGLVNQANANYAIYLATVAEIHQWVKNEFDERGFNSLSNKIDRNQRINEESKTKILSELAALKVMIRDGRADAETKEAIENIAIAIANMTADIADLKTLATAPSAPAFDFAH
jgi:hypothetical protein